MSEDESSILNGVFYFFKSPLWNDTIQDFILSHCTIFTGEDEYDHNHFKCHKEFCTIVENILTAYLLGGLGITFDQFKEALLASYQVEDSIGAEIYSIFIQATDFQYFASKMYFFNILLDSQVMEKFDSNALESLFVSEEDYSAYLQEFLERQAAISSQLEEMEATLNIPSTLPEATNTPAAPPSTPSNSTTSTPTPAPPKPAQLEEEKKKLIESERQKLQQEIATAAPPPKLPDSASTSNPNEVLKQALTKRVKDMIDES